MSAAPTMDGSSTTFSNYPKRRGRKRRRTPEAPCADCIQRASQSSSKGDVRFCSDCARTLGHAPRSLPELPTKPQAMMNNNRVKKPDYRRRATTNRITAALATTQSSIKLPRQPAIRVPKEKLVALPPAFESLKQAFDMLQPVEGRLSSLILGIDSRDQATITPFSQDAYRQQSRTWLDNWERAFTTYLSRNVNMTIEERKAAMTLKAHHLIAETFGAVQLTEAQLDWTSFNTQFAAVLHLAAEVVKESPTQQVTRFNSLDKYQSALPDISILDPVYEVQIRSTQPALHDRAKQLLTVIDPNHFSLNGQQVYQHDAHTLLQSNPTLTTINLDDSNPALPCSP